MAQVFRKVHLRLLILWRQPVDLLKKRQLHCWSHLFLSFQNIQRNRPNGSFQFLKNIETINANPLTQGIFLLRCSRSSLLRLRNAHLF